MNGASWQVDAFHRALETGPGTGSGAGRHDPALLRTDAGRRTGALLAGGVAPCGHRLTEPAATRGDHLPRAGGTRRESARSRAAVRPYGDGVPSAVEPSGKL